MRLFFGCPECKKGYCIAAVDPDKYLLLEGKTPCPNEGCTGTLVKAKKDFCKKPVYSSALALFKQAMGRGSVEEQRCSAAELELTFINDVIVRMDLEDLPGKDRCIVNRIYLVSGRVIHLASSTMGATIYKVTKEAR